jgi:cold shock CspA family protein/ribosome-associated translation inhibitor RaiA
MKEQPEIIFLNLERTPEIEKIISKGLDKLEKINNRIIKARISVQQTQSRRKEGNPYQMRIDIEIPGRAMIIVKRISHVQKNIPDIDGLHGTAIEDGPGYHKHTGRSSVRRRGVREESLVTLIQRTFDLAQRELKKITEKQRGDVKTPAPNVMAVIEKIFRDRGYGFLRTTDGEQIYFNKSSVLHSHWDSLQVGTSVRYTPELGDEGLQASTIEPLEKPGAAELHNSLHELPVFTLPRRKVTTK